MSITSSIKALGTLGQGAAGGISDATEDADPIDLFYQWFEAAVESDILLPESVALATADAEGHPSVRMVLMKNVDKHGFVFFTNYSSRKATELEANPHAALCFHWALQERQVRVTGVVTKISQEESDAYFQSRGRGSRVGAWASKQSQPLPARSRLEQRTVEVRDRFANTDVPLPPFWGGYRIDPETIEFWQGRADRLHDRLVFSRGTDGWATKRLYP